MASKRSVQECQAKIEEYHKEWSPYLGVEQQWTVSLSVVDKSQMKNRDSAAEATWPSFYRTAKIKFCANWLKEGVTDEDLETTVVHELCHLVYSDTWDFICEQFGDGKIRDLLLDQEERNVDILTRFLMRSKYENNRLGELYDSTEPESVESSEGLWTDPDDSRGIIRPSGTSTATSGCRRRSRS